MEQFIWIPALIILLGVLVCFHELGHFIMAKLLKIRVDEFAFGFGPKWLVLAKRGDTEYTIHPYPLGGFVKLAGQEPGEEEVEGGFHSKPWWARWLVYSAGPFMSLLLAYLVFCFMGFTVGLPINNEVMNKVDLIEPGSLAQKAGLKVGDVILSIDGKIIDTGKQMLDTVHGSGEKLITLEVQRGEKIIELSAVPETKMVVFESMGFSAQRANIKEDPLFSIGRIERGSYAVKVGLKSGDKIISINGKRAESGPDLVSFVKISGIEPATIVIDRDGSVIKQSVAKDAAKLDKDESIAFLGFIPKQKLQRVSIIQSVKYGNDTTFMFAKTMVTVLFSKQVKDAVGGPIAIASETQNGVKRGFYGYLQLMAALSLSLGVFNLFPIPIVDGGQMLLLTVEGIRRKRFAQRTWEIAQIVGIAMLGLIFVLVMTMDINRLLNGTIFK